MSGHGVVRRYPGLLLAGLAILILVLASLVPRAPDGVHPEGTEALRRFLIGMGLEARHGPEPPAIPGTFVLLADLRDTSEARRLLEWAGRGGRLVVADPRSAVASLLDVRSEDRIGGLTGTQVLVPGCAAPEAVGVAGVRVRVSDSALTVGSRRATSCFPGRDGAFEILVPNGEGTIAVLGGTSPLTNALLDQEDDAAFALRLLDAGGAVVFGPPLPPSATAQGSPWDLLPPSAKVVIVELALAAVLFALVRGRRLGRPVLEDPISPIPASELVRATGRLYRRARAVGFAGRLLRMSLARRLASPLGIPSQPTPGDLTQGMVRAGLPRDAVREALEGPEPRTDEDLLALARTLEMMERTVSGGPRQ